jgi:hypothetical protein
MNQATKSEKPFANNAKKNKTNQDENHDLSNESQDTLLDRLLI